MQDYWSFTCCLSWILGSLFKLACLSLFCKHYFGRYSSELAQLVLIPYYQGSYSACYSDRLHDFSVTIPRCYKDVYVNSLFPCTAKPWNSLPIECFPLKNYDRSGFKFRINRHILTAGSLWTEFLYALIVLYFFFL